MGSSCERLRPLLYRVLEQEAEPGEAIEVAGHLSDCTACKIALAKKRRLSELLEEDLADLPVGEEFLRSVMDRLPEGPPPPRRLRRTQRGLKLAAWGGALGLGLDWVVRELMFAEAGVPRLGRPRLPASEDWTFGGLVELLRWAQVALEALAGAAPLQLFTPLADGQALTALLAGGLAAVLCASALLLATAGPLLRQGAPPPRSPARSRTVSRTA